MHTNYARFMTIDPMFFATPGKWLSDPQAQHAYAYARNNPVKYNDPNGEYIESFLDIGFLMYDIGALIHDEIKTGGENRALNTTALGADAVGLLVPFGTGFGMGVRVAAHADDVVKVASHADDAVRAVAHADEAVKTVSTTSNVVTNGWKVGDPITNNTAKGNIPSWSTVRQRHWKNEALNNSSNYSAENLSRMQTGKAPQIYDVGINKVTSMELHHTPIPRRDGGLFNFIQVTPSQHAAIDRFRNKFLRK